MAPSKLVTPLLKTPLLSHLDPYVLINEKAGDFNLTYSFHTLLAWMRRCLKSTAPRVLILESLDLKYHIAGERKQL